MSDPALQLDDFNNQDLRDVADRLLETTKVEYVDEGVLLIMNPPGIEHRRIVHTVIDAAKKAYYTGQATVNWETYETYQWSSRTERAATLYRTSRSSIPMRSRPRRSARRSP